MPPMPKFQALPMREYYDSNLSAVLLEGLKELGRERYNFLLLDRRILYDFWVNSYYHMILKVKMIIQKIRVRRFLNDYLLKIINNYIS